MQNFPEASYSTALPALAATTPDRVVEALRRDAQLSLARGSRFRGVRRVGGLHGAAVFEARLPALRQSGEAAAAPANNGAAWRPAGVAPPGAEPPVQLAGLPDEAAQAHPDAASEAPTGWEQQWQGGAQAMSLDQQLAAAAGAAAAAREYLTA